MEKGGLLYMLNMLNENFYDKELEQATMQYSTSKIAVQQTAKKMRTYDLMDLYMAIKDDEDIKNSKKYRITSNKLAKLSECGSWVKFDTDSDFKNYKKVDGRDCGDIKFCPRCSYLHAKKEAVRLATIMNYLQQEYDCDFIFLTLTTPNVTGDKLGDKLSDMQKGWRAFSRIQRIVDSTLGMFCKLEITYNAKENTYHPHYHVLIAVPKKYFNTGLYISQMEWLAMWIRSMKDESIEIVDVRRVTENKDKDSDIEVNDATYEMSKYATKDTDYLNNGKDVFKVFYKALHHRNMIKSNGVFMEAIKLYKQGELGDYKPKSDVEWKYRVTSTWSDQVLSYENHVERLIGNEDNDFVTKGADAEWNRKEWRENMTGMRVGRRQTMANIHEWLESIGAKPELTPKQKDIQAAQDEMRRKIKEYAKMADLT